MAANWTTEQKQVITARNHALLVSAAAGAGKTAVLTERILSLVCGDLPGTEPVDIDRLLVVTFTRAAAAEMRERISDKLHARLEAEPDNVHLQRQTTLLHHAQICTIDSFCTYLLRTFFYEIDLDPGFRIAEAGEMQLLRKEIVQALLEERYEQGSEEFLSFADYFAAGKNDSRLEELILNLYEAAQSHPDPGKWLQSCLQAYEADTEEAFWDAMPGRLLKEQVTRQVQSCQSLCRQAKALIDEPEGPKEYEKALAAEAAWVEVLADPQKCTEWYAALQTKKTGKLCKAKEEKTPEGELLAQKTETLVKAVREVLADIKKTSLPIPPAEMAARLQICRAPVMQLIELTNAFAANFFAAKQEKNVLDFGDTEHLALRILTDAEGNPTQTAKDLRNCYAEIMIDEYQDSNLLQERLLTAIAKEDGSNLFLVGDVKQSIYQFRQAHPELFIEKLDTYVPLVILQPGAAGAADTRIQKTEQPEVTGAAYGSSVREKRIVPDSPAAAADIGSIQGTQTVAECPATERVETTDRVPRSISLHKNFRSRPEVLHSANVVFTALMRREAGGIVYDEAAKLYAGAAYEPDARYRTEVLSFHESVLEEKSGRADVIAAEAQLVANRILELTDPASGLPVGNGEERHIAAYGDIVILLRSRGQWAETFVNTLMENGIPAYAESTTGFFAAQEIQTVLQYLALLDNRQQDLPMAAVLTSPIGGFSADDLAKIRTAFPDSAFCDAVCTYAAHGMDGMLRLRLQRFLAQVDALRERVPYTQIHALLWQIYEETGYYAFASAMPGGSLRRANLDMLVQQALTFEKTSYRGLFHFLRYVEQVQKYDIDIGEASALQETVSAVRIMTIHKSKGLEFPIVFLSGLAKQFNDQDDKQQIVTNATGGIGVDVVNVELRSRQPSAVKQIIRRQNHLESRAEEIRILYVAMTRAREKLILTAGYKDKNEIERGMPHPLLYQDIVSANSMWKWLRLIVGTDIEAFACREVTAGEIAGETKAVAESAADAEKTGSNMQSGGAAAQEREDKMQSGGADVQNADVLYAQARELLDRMRYVYPHGGQAHAAKVSVSELKMRAMHEVDDSIPGDKLYEEPVPVPLLPKFAEPTKENVAAARGMAYHKVLECLDYHTETDEISVQKLLAQLTADGRLREQDAKAVDPSQIVTFVQSALGQRMKQAALAQTLRREQPFVYGIPASELYEDAKAEDQVLIQGIIDAYFEEDGKLVIVDYKTDRVSKENGAEKLLKLYRTQIVYYARALSALLAKPVKEAYLYSLALEAAVPCEISGEGGRR